MTKRYIHIEYRKENPDAPREWRISMVAPGVQVGTTGELKTADPVEALRQIKTWRCESDVIIADYFGDTYLMLLEAAYTTLSERYDTLLAKYTAQIDALLSD